MIQASEMVLHPPEVAEVFGPVIFTAGPIRGARDWQSEAIKHIHSIDDSIVVASPSREYADGEFVSDLQIDWETHNLQRAARFGTIMFFFAEQDHEVRKEGSVFPLPYARTSREELGVWRTEKKYNPEVNLVVGIEKAFGSASYIRRRLEQDCPDVPILNDLESTCVAAVGLAVAARQKQST